ncbi:hypothetical protein C8R48DRAFT_679873 [Suillus tomentosus]|nr:hypothetical protein C8R48DRAFT_679873 [Suillus tomentosus]
MDTVAADRAIGGWLPALCRDDLETIPQAWKDIEELELQWLRSGTETDTRVDDDGKTWESEGPTLAEVALLASRCEKLSSLGMWFNAQDWFDDDLKMDSSREEVEAEDLGTLYENQERRTNTQAHIWIIRTKDRHLVRLRELWVGLSLVSVAASQRVSSFAHSRFPHVAWFGWDYSRAISALDGWETQEWSLVNDTFVTMYPRKRLREQVRQLDYLSSNDGPPESQRFTLLLWWLKACRSDTQHSVSFIAITYMFPHRNPASNVPAVVQDTEVPIVISAFSLCTAGADNTFNLSFDSLTSVEARRMLRDLPRTAPDMWEHIQSRRQPASEDPAVPALVPEDIIDDDDEPGDEAPLELLLQFVASGKKCAPDGYRIDVDGSLVVDSAADMFEEVLMSEEPGQMGRGKRRRVVNKQYDGFEQH